MYTETKSLQDIKKANSKNDIVIHFICLNCDDEQVTDIYDKGFVDKERIWKGEIMDRILCTNCGTSTLFLTENNITGYETV